MTDQQAKHLAECEWCQKKEQKVDEPSDSIMHRYAEHEHNDWADGDCTECLRLDLLRETEPRPVTSNVKLTVDPREYGRRGFLR